MDFCAEVLGTTVEASQVSTDTYEVTNLISAQRSTRGRGFMVERFIKPPVDITFIFDCAVDLHQVVLNTVIGCQRSVGIDLVALRSDGPLIRRPGPKPAPPKYHESVIAKVFLQEGEDRVCFVNRRYRPRPPFNEWREEPVPDGIPTREMRDLPGRVCGVRLRLWRSAAGSLLAMKSVRIQAAPSRDTPDHLVAKLVALVRPPAAVSGNSAEGSKNKGTQPVKSDAMIPVGKRGDQYDFHSSQQARVPPEFVDPLTCELMTFPVILPSGNTVDQSSLDRHIQSESRWGRLPSDPFTGLPLLNSDSKRRVLPNALLKTRIDRYLLLNAGILTGDAGRATGGKRGPSDSDPTGVPTTKLSRVLNGRHDTAVPSTVIINAENIVLAVSERVGPSSDPIARNGVVVVQESDDTADCTTGDHQQRLDRSLDNALKSALGSLKKFSGSSSSNRWDRVFAPPPGCARCRITPTESADNKSPLYRLPCSHLLCRNCVTVAAAAQQQTCATCRAAFTGSDLSRVHLG